MVQGKEIWKQCNIQLPCLSFLFFSQNLVVALTIQARNLWSQTEGIY
jgi:hypothetical protein